MNSKREYSPTTKRIIAKRALLNKNRDEYTRDDLALLRSIINKQVGTDWATEGHEPAD